MSVYMHLCTVCEQLYVCLSVCALVRERPTSHISLENIAAVCVFTLWAGLGNEARCLYV